MMEQSGQAENQTTPETSPKDGDRKDFLSVTLPGGFKIEGKTSLVVVIILVIIIEAVLIYLAIFELNKPKSLIKALLIESIDKTFTALPTIPPLPTYTPAPPATVEIIVTEKVEVTRIVERSVVQTQIVPETVVHTVVVTHTPLPPPENLIRGIQEAFDCTTKKMVGSEQRCGQWLATDEIEGDISLLKSIFVTIENAEWKIDSPGDYYPPGEGRDFHTFDKMESTLTIKGSYSCGGERYAPETFDLEYESLVWAKLNDISKVQIVYWKKRENPFPIYLCSSSIPTP